MHVFSNSLLRGGNDTLVVNLLTKHKMDKYKIYPHRIMFTAQKNNLFKRAELFWGICLVYVCLPLFFLPRLD